jgi:phospholipid/cholesterol/gamma-HCH transport system ATP-binding protein
LTAKSDSDVVIRVSKLAKSLGGQPVLRSVDLEMRRGETIVIMGRSGCGKSVLLKHLIGLLAPDRGTIEIDGADVTSDRRLARTVHSQFGMLFQSGALFDSLTVGENVALPYLENSDHTEEEITALVAEKLAMVGLPDVNESMPAELSGGMRKRVALARALAQEPEFVLYDEPTTGLDPIMADTINDLIIRLQKELGVTSIVVTHDLASARKVANRVAMLHGGMIIFEGPVSELNSSVDPRVRQFVEGQADGPIQPHPDTSTLR